MATFPSIQPDHPISGDNKNREERTGLGAGLEYVARFGLNCSSGTWRPRWSRLSNSERSTIEAFLEARALDGDSFDWTPPGAAGAQRFRVDEWEPARTTPTGWALDLEFRKVFETSGTILVRDPCIPEIAPGGATVYLVGGGGAGTKRSGFGPDRSGGRGARASFVNNVLSGQVYTLVVGGGGNYTTGAGGFGGGGNAIPTTSVEDGGAGGGYSGLFTGGAAIQTNAVLIAGGGGGASGDPAEGGRGGDLTGLDGSAGAQSGTRGGGGGTQTAGGAGGVGGGNGQAGSALQGGNGYAWSGSPEPLGPGAGGGAGYFGGGGGARNGPGAGGGGSSFIRFDITGTFTLPGGSGVPAGAGLGGLFASGGDGYAVVIDANGIRTDYPTPGIYLIAGA
jgi:phage-related protein